VIRGEGLDGKGKNGITSPKTRKLRVRKREKNGKGGKMCESGVEGLKKDF